eukprot:175588_1
MAQIAETTEEGETFSFERWISQNGLGELKDLFVKHKAMTLQSLQLTSTELQGAMSELFLKHPAKVPLIMAAIQNLTEHAQSNKETRPYIVVCEEEDATMIAMKQNLGTLEDIKTQLDSLKEALPQSAQRIEKIKLVQINATKAKIIKTFKDISDALQSKQIALLQELDKIQSQTIDFKQRNIDNDDEKEVDLLSSSMERLVSQKQSLSSSFSKCENMVKETKDNKKETKEARKEKILGIGKKAKVQFDTAKNELDSNMANIRNMIDMNNKYEMNIDFVINNAYNKILKKIQNVGVIQNDVYDPSKPREEKANDIEDPDDVTIQKLTNSVEQLKQSTKQSLVTSLSFDAEASFKWYYDQDEKDNDPQIGSVLSINNEQHVLLKDVVMKNNVPNNAISAVPTMINENYLNDAAKHIRTLKKVALETLCIGTFVPYTVTVGTSGAPGTMQQLITSDCNKISYTSNVNPSWIQATFTQQVTIKQMHMAASGTGVGWGITYLNGKERQLQYLSNGSWVNIMTMDGFKQDEIRMFNINVTTTAIRVYAGTQLWTGIGCWRFFK